MDNQEIDFKKLFSTEESKPESENKEPEPVKEPEKEPDKEPENAPPKKRSKYAIYPIAIFLVLAILASFLLFIMNDKDKNYFAIYSKNSDVYIYRTDTHKTIKFDIKNESDRFLFCYGFSASDPQKFLYTLADTVNSSYVYYVVFDENGESFGDPVLISDKVSGNYYENTLFTSGRLFYLTADEYSLFMYDGKEPIKLGDNVNNFRVNEKADRVVYLDKENNLYQVGIDASVELIESQITYFLCDTELNHTYFRKENTLYDKPFNKAKKEIAKDVFALDERFLTEDGLYYTVVPEDKMSYYDIVDDPDPSDKSMEEIREKLKSMNFHIDVYFYNGKKSDLVAKHVNYFNSLNPDYTSKTASGFYYYKINEDEHKKYNIKNISVTDNYVFVIKDTDTGKKLFSDFKRENYVLVNNKEYFLTDSTPLIVSFDKNYAYYVKYQPSQDSKFKIELYQVKLNSSKETLIDTDIDLSFIWAAENGKIYYLKNRKDIYVNGELLVSDMGGISTISRSDDNCLVFLTQTDSKLSKLALIKDNIPIIVSEKVVKYPIYNNDVIFFLEASDEKKSNNTLKLYKDDVITDIESDVSAIQQVILLP